MKKALKYRQEVCKVNRGFNKKNSRISEISKERDRYKTALQKAKDLLFLSGHTFLELDKDAIAQAIHEGLIEIEDLENGRTHAPRIKESK